MSAVQHLLQMFSAAIMAVGYRKPKPQPEGAGAFQRKKGRCAFA
jgi:hypothetical protein